LFTFRFLFTLHHPFRYCGTNRKKFICSYQYIYIYIHKKS